MIDELTHLLTDPAHWIFEGVTDLAYTGLILTVGRIPFRRWLRRHDAEAHSTNA